MFARVVLLGLFFVAVAAPAHDLAVAVQTQGEAGGGLVRCGTLSASRAEADAVNAAVDHYKSALHGGPRFGTIQVAMHIITCKGEGNVPQSQIDAQIRELNSAYRGTGFSFVLTSVDRTENCQWFNAYPGNGNEKKMKEALAIDPAHHLNVYSIKPGHFLLGWAYYPQSFPETSFWHGVVMHYGTFPGNYAAPYNLGGTLDHEAGHYLGLAHTFEGGCVAPGDDVDDTPFEASPAFGCPVGRNTCPQPGDDPIHNYMDYTDDACYSEFSAGQRDRMQFIVPVYKPSLIAGSSLVRKETGASLARTGMAGGLEFRGVWPNPFSKATTLRFVLAKDADVSIDLLNVAGQRVRTIVSGPMAAGERSVSLAAGTLAPGMYFATVRVGEESVTRSIVLVP